MQDSAIRALEEAAPAPFVNGDASHRVDGDEPAKTKPSARRLPAKETASSLPAAEAQPLPFTDGLAEILRLQDEWRERVTLMAHEQLSYVTTAGRELLAAGEAIAAEPELGRRLELFWAQALHQLERSMEHSTRFVQVLGGIVEPVAAGPRRRAG
jgi:hypothetical protein